MSTKNVYFFKAIIRDTHSNTEMPVTSFKNLFKQIFDDSCINQALALSYQDTEPVVLDVLENNDEYLFAKLNRKRPNNSMQKRNYETYETTDVLAPDEIDNKGVEWFTYCILGYSHGILSIANSKGAPHEGCLARIFERYNCRYIFETERIMNPRLIDELVSGHSPEINKVQFNITRPDAEILEKLFGFNESALLRSIGQNTLKLGVEIKPDFRGALLSNKRKISRFVNSIMQRNPRFSSAVITGKKNTGERQREYDLYEEYFKYPIEIREWRQVNGQKVEIEKETILEEYKDKMKAVYDQHKHIVLDMCGRQINTE